MKAKIDLVSVFVKDMAASVRFYRDVMGFAVKLDLGPYVEFVSEGVRLALFERTELTKLLGREPGYPQGLNGTFELAINVGAKENVDAVFGEYTAKGAPVVYAPRDEPWKMRSAMVADPDGNLIEIGSDFWE